MQVKGLVVRGPNGEEIKEGEGILVWDKFEKCFRIISSIGAAYALPVGFKVDGEDLEFSKHQHKVVPLPKEKCYCLQTELMEVPHG